MSGVGNSLSTSTNDAFYGVFDDGSYVCVEEGEQIKESCDFVPTYQLGTGSESLPFTIAGGGDTENFITFIDSIGFVTPGTTPAYNSSNHAYHFVMDLSLLNVNSSSLLTFGNTDDYNPDNAGTYMIDIYQLQAIPIPPSVWLFGSGLLGLVGIARKKAA